ARQLLQGGSPDDAKPVPLTPLHVQQRGCALNQSLPHASRLRVPIANNRTPDGFQRLVREPVFAGVEQVPGAAEDCLTLVWCHGRQRAAEGGRGVTETTTADPCRQLLPLLPLSAA